MASQSPIPPESVKSEDPIVKTEPATPGTGISNDTIKVMKGIVEYLTEYRDKNGKDVAALFQRMVNKRLIPDYFDVIKEPIAFSTIRGKILKKQYKTFREFVRDVALICHNAQVYNRPSALVYQDAITLRDLFKNELQKLVDENTILAEDAMLPDFGEIPPVEDSPPIGPEEEEAEDEDDEDDEDEDEDDSDDEGRRRSRRRARRSSAAVAKREGGKVDDAKEDPESHKKRGRPPKVHTPMEARINSVLKGLRKYKNPGGDLKIVHFEKLPDKTIMPEYYQEIKTPMAMDLIKKKAKRKKYQSVDQVMKDLELMFENAKAYNLEDSQVYRDAVDLQRESRILAEQEKKKPDSDYVDEDGKLPLPEILHNGEIWKVGDWVHLQNPNDLTKPIVAQIYRTWQDPEGQKWINACWYYRPEQTVHRYDKHFFENEVVKTGQYRDHHIDEVVDRCFVMFFTRYNKGRPRGFPADKEVYVCEARYNEDKFKLNKIKTWASCVPDEVRERDYEMDLFDAPRKMKKVPSPIKHLLREDAKEDDLLPKPTWGAANAPPIVGAVHKRPREANESPPPEPTPSPPPPPPPEPVRHPVSTERVGIYNNPTDTLLGPTSTHRARSPASAQQHQPQGSYGQQFAPSRPSASPAPPIHQNSFATQSNTQHAATSQNTQFTPSTMFNTHYSSTTTVPPPILPQSQTPNPLANYEAYRASASNRIPAPTTVQASSSPNAYNPPRPVEVYHLVDSANASIPPDIRAQFHRDEHDRVLFFTAPPIDAPPIPKSARTLGHSIRYLAAKAREREAAKAASGTSSKVTNNNPVPGPPTPESLEIPSSITAARASESESGKDAPRVSSDATRPKRKASEIEHDNNERIKRLRDEALGLWCAEMEKGTALIHQQMHGDHWMAAMEETNQRLAAAQEELKLRDNEYEEKRKEMERRGF